LINQNENQHDRDAISYELLQNIKFHSKIPIYKQRHNFNGLLTTNSAIPNRIITNNNIVNTITMLKVKLFSI